MSDIIKVLPDHIANQIAAGEVVQRPASVVKELMENAVDAAATHIIVSVRQGGRQLIKVTDNGCGMSPTDARNSFLRHATSKISTAEDLFRLHTKGFRGEALASIAAVAQVELTTRRAEDELGVRICIEGSEYKKTESLPAAVGTTLSVKNLFFNIPARRNFLKSDTLEFSRIADEFVRVALAHPELAFELYRDDTLVHKLSPSGLRRRIVSIFKSNTDNKLVPVEENTDIVKIGGFVFVQCAVFRLCGGEQGFHLRGQGVALFGQFFQIHSFSCLLNEFFVSGPVLRCLAGDLRADSQYSGLH